MTQALRNFRDGFSRSGALFVDLSNPIYLP